MTSITKEEIGKLCRLFPNAKISSVTQPVSEKDFELQHHKHLSRQALGGAVGLITSPESEIILVKRTGMHAGWALPGGTVEKGEEFLEAYEREVMEEVGIALIDTSLVLIEQKEFLSPSGRKLDFLLAVFNSNTNIRKLPPPTSDAIQEGLTVSLFKPTNLPSNIILGDRSKIDTFWRPAP